MRLPHRPRPSKGLTVAKMLRPMSRRIVYPTGDAQLLDAAGNPAPLRETDLNFLDARGYRWLQAGLHRPDLAPALRGRPQWDVLMLLLLAIAASY